MSETVEVRRVQKVMTFKAGKFVLSRNYRPEDIQDVSLRFKSLYGVLAATPILPNIADRLDRELIRRSVFSTAAIEGNPLSEERVGEILDEPPTLRSERADQEIVNLGRAYARFKATSKDKSRTPLVVSEEYIREINRFVTANIDLEHHSPGMYRNVPVEVGDSGHGGAYKPPKSHEDIKTLMAAFVAWINSEDVLAEGPLVRAFLAHYHLGRIHPFCDGNGRTARLLEAAILTHSGYRFIPQTLSNYYYTNVDDYYIAFREAEKAANDDVSPFLIFCFKMLVLAVEEVQNRVHWHIRLLALRDFYNFSLQQRTISKRQHDLLQILLTRGDNPFTLQDLFLDPSFVPLYRGVSERTARRDLERLENGQFLLAKDEKRLLNPFTLDVV